MTHDDSERRDRSDPTDRTGPRPSDAQDAPEPERLSTPAEEAGAAPHQLDEPPQAEGDRDDDRDGARGD